MVKSYCQCCNIVLFIPFKLWSYLFLCKVGLMLWWLEYSLLQQTSTWVLFTPDQSWLWGPCLRHATTRVAKTGSLWMDVFSVTFLLVEVKNLNASFCRTVWHLVGTWYWIESSVLAFWLLRVFAACPLLPVGFSVILAYLVPAFPYLSIPPFMNVVVWRCLSNMMLMWCVL